MARKDQLLETFTIFEDVFVPWERVFMCGEWQYSGDMANIFASVNRQGYLGADVGKLDIFIGAAHRIAELNGVADAPHVRDKITQMIKLQALIWSTGVAASMHATIMEPGVAVPDAVYANTGKHVAMEGHYLATRLLLEIAGGAVETLPAIEDQRAPELKPYFDKYYAGATGTAEERMRLFRFIRDLTASEYAGGGTWRSSTAPGRRRPSGSRCTGSTTSTGPRSTWTASSWGGDARGRGETAD